MALIVDLGRGYSISKDELRELVFMAAGASMGVAMQDHPDYIFPTERVTDVTEKLLRDFHDQCDG